MNILKRIGCSAGCILIAALLLTGCSHAKSAITILSDAIMATAQLDTMTMQWEARMEMDISLPEDVGQVPASLIMRGDTLGDIQGQLAHTTGSIQLESDYGEILQDMEIYTGKEDANTVLYTNLSDLWIKTPSDNAAADLSCLNILRYLQEFKDVFVVNQDTVMVGDQECYEMKAILAPDDLEMVMKEYTSVLVQDPDTMEAGSLLAEIDWSGIEYSSIGMQLHVNTDTGLPADMNLYLEEWSESRTEDETAADEELNVNENGQTQDIPSDAVISSYALKSRMKNVVLTATFTYNNADNIRIPQEAKEGITLEELAEKLAAEKTEKQGNADGSSLYREDGSFLLLDEFEEGAYPLLEEENFRVDLIRVYQGTDSICYADLLMKNMGKTDLDIYTRGVAVNRTMIPDASLYQHLPQESEAFVTLQMNMGNYGEENLEEVYVEFEVVDTVNVYVEDYNSGVLIYRPGSKLVEHLQTPDETGAADLKSAESDEMTLENDSLTDEELTAEGSEAETSEEAGGNDSEDKAPGKAALNSADDPSLDQTKKEEDETLEMETASNDNEDQVNDRYLAVEERKAAMAEGEVILLEEEELTIVEGIPLVEDSKIRIPLDIINTSGSNVIMEGSSFTGEDGNELDMNITGVIFDGCRLLREVLVDSAGGKSVAKQVLDAVISKEKAGIELAEGELLQESVSETASEETSLEETEETEETVNTEEGQSEEESEAELPMTRRMTFSVVGYDLEDYHKGIICFRYPKVMLEY